MKTTLACATLIGTLMAGQATANTSITEATLNLQNITVHDCDFDVDNVVHVGMSGGFRLLFRDVNVAAGESIRCTVTGSIPVPEGTQLIVKSQPNMAVLSSAEGELTFSQSYGSQPAEYYTITTEEREYKRPKVYILNEDSAKHPRVSVGVSQCGQDLPFVLEFEAQNHSEGEQFMKVRLSSTANHVVERVGDSVQISNEYAIEHSNCE